MRGGRQEDVKGNDLVVWKARRPDVAERRTVVEDLKQPLSQLSYTDSYIHTYIQTVARDSVSIREYWLPIAYDESGAPW